MNLPSVSLIDSIERGLRFDDLDLTCVSGGHWSLTTGNGGGQKLNIHRHRDWLEFNCTDEGSSANVTSQKLWHAMERNQKLPAGLKLSLNSERRLELRSDLLLTEETNVENRVRGVVNAFRQAWSGDSYREENSPVELETLEHLCEEAGWSSVRRSSGRLTVALNVTPAQQAVVTPHGNGMQLEVEATHLVEHSKQCRAAAAALALELVRTTRLVRASVNPDSTKLIFEICWPVVPLPEELNAGFTAMCSVVRDSVDKFNALKIEQLAGDYLSVRGWSAANRKRKTTRRKTKKGNV